MKRPRKDGKPWVRVPILNTIPYTQEILAELRKGPVRSAQFPHIKHFHDKVSTLRKLLPEGYLIEGEYVWTKGKLGINHREYQYSLITPSRVSKPADSSTLSATHVS
jgi:hypothetical protein